MTTLREAAQNVVEVWKLYGTTESLRGWMEILEAALAEPVQEPVAWSHINGTSDTKWHPPQRKPLSEEEITQCFKDAGIAIKGQHWTNAVRNVERAHGIKE